MLLGDDGKARGLQLTNLQGNVVSVLFFLSPAKDASGKQPFKDLGCVFMHFGVVICPGRSAFIVFLLAWPL